jgi:hypothetical protein
MVVEGCGSLVGRLSVALQVADFLLEEGVRRFGRVFPVEPGTGEQFEQILHLGSGGDRDLNGLGCVLGACHGVRLIGITMALL